MDKELEMHEYTKVLVPAKQYDFDNDKRLLIPFTSGERIGFVNRNREIVVHPKYTMYYGDCYSESDYIKVSVAYNYGFSRANGGVSSYSCPLYGLINHKGEVIIEPDNRSLLVAKNGNEILLTIQRKDYSYGVINLHGEEIVPFGKYKWIDGFEKGLARVKNGKVSNGHVENDAKWGIINEQGIEIFPTKYDNIWNFYGKSYDSIIIEEGEVRKYISFDSLFENEWNMDVYFNDLCEEKQTYNEYNGSYAQDVMGYSDQTIGDAFEGDPDAYWNID